MESKETERKSDHLSTGVPENLETDELPEEENLVISEATNEIVEAPIGIGFSTLVPDVNEVDLFQYIQTPNDTNDPSYTDLTLPYRVICRQRYRRAGLMQKKQFIREIRAHELLKVKALDGVRIHREFCNPIIKPVSQDELIKLTKKQQDRLEKLLNEP